MLGSGGSSIAGSQSLACAGGWFTGGGAGYTAAVRCAVNGLSLAASLLLSLPLVLSGQTKMHFGEVSQQWGIDFRHHHGGSGQWFMVETMVGGVVVFDYDGDGDADLFFVDGGSLPGYSGEPARSRLLRNDGRHFVDVTQRSAIRSDLYGAGGTAGDVDGDGDLDLYLTAFGANRLWVNHGDGTFHDGTAAAGVGESRWSMSAAFFDPDHDGDLDLYVVNYVDFTLDNHQFCGDRKRGIRVYCDPDTYNPYPDTFYRNRGDGTFEEATADAGLAREPGAGLGVVAGDLDGDGWSDLYVANDLTPNFLLHNRGDGTFEDLSLISGVAYSDRGFAESGMGVDVGDYDGDGDSDLVVTNYEFQTNGLYRNSGSNLFLDSRYIAGIAESSIKMLAFGVLFGDFDHDADLDLMVANGHLNQQVAELTPGSRYEQPHQLFENTGSGRFKLTETAANGLAGVKVSRALAVADLDRDGDQDLVVVNSNDRAEVYENLAGAESGDWLQVELAPAGSAPGGVGARLLAAAEESGAKWQLRQLLTARSYLAQSELVAHFGFPPDADAALKLEVRWPAGRQVRIEGLQRNRRIRLVER